MSLTTRVRYNGLATTEIKYDSLHTLYHTDIFGRTGPSKNGVDPDETP